MAYINLYNGSQVILINFHGAHMACEVATETEMHVKVPALISRAHPLNIPFNDLGPQCCPNFAGIQQPYPSAKA